MRLKSYKSCLFLVVLILFKILMFYFVTRLISSLLENTIEENLVKPTMAIPRKKLSEQITIIMREFEPHENDVSLTSQSFTNLFATMQQYIMYDEFPYPPLDIMLNNDTSSSVKFVKLSPELRLTYKDIYPLNNILTKYVLFVPDSTRLSSRETLQHMVNKLSSNPGSIIAAATNNRKYDLNCLRMIINTREWMLKFDLVKSTNCHAVIGKHVILMETELLQRVSNAFLLPFPHSLYLQTASLDLKVTIMKGLSFHEGKPLFRSHHSQWKQKQAEVSRLKSLYNVFKIKRVVRETGLTEWYGCTKDTSRCFGTILDSMPSYLYEKRWTPPCCLSNLRKTARHVFNMLDQNGVRYWLEAGSLLGAMRNGDILPWDHDVDVGFIREDSSRCEWLKKAKSRSVVDTKGFLWEKATEGNFFRVHFSKVNKIHVNLFPFFSKNGTMARDSWYTTHKNMEFPENFLHPMSSIEFVGRNVPSPNNIRDFLELKFGKGAIEIPEYPDPNKLKFP
ncbi:unnamed protein product [Phyllotreta striolata]|uniref:Fukutin-related protein n=1 Tax=Phyllotreta striolata TaxID=444603 RepID=A0A9N9TRX7_PHYSR|nr:unnamed protein product [Phyllotreta striolata]